MKKIFLLVVSMLLILPLSQAMIVNYENIDDSGRPGEQTSYRVILNNNENKIYRIYILTTSPWESSISPIYSFEISPYETKEVTATFDVPKDEIRGSYLHQLDIKWDEGSYAVPLISDVIIDPYGKVKITEMEVRDIDPTKQNYVFKQAIHMEISMLQ